MLEELCRQSFWDACTDVEEKYYSLVRLKPSYEMRETVYKFGDFFEYIHQLRQNWMRCPVTMVRGPRGGNQYQTRQKAWVWFNEHANSLRDHYIKARYRGSMESAMNDSGTFTDLFDGFYDYFAERRNDFMEKTNELIEQRKNELARMGKHPQSHGGVANLLKVLTKTMHEQGNSIYTIAEEQNRLKRIKAILAVAFEAALSRERELLEQIMQFEAERDNILDFLNGEEAK